MSGAVPPTCAPGSSGGLKVARFRDRRSQGGGVVFTLETQRIELDYGTLRFTAPSGRYTLRAPKP